MTTNTQNLSGQSILAGVPTAGNGREVHGYNPATNQALDPAYSLIDTEQLKLATTAAAAAFDSFRSLDPQKHADFLDAIAANIEASGDELVARAMAETGLPEARLVGERGRTCNQLRLFAQVIRQGDHHGVRIDPALPERTPLPRADIRQRKVPVGPVAVFGASNFPLAFSTAGGDTASALAAGCPVVFKAHNAHPGTSEIVGAAITKAVAEFDLHPGVFSLVYGPGASIGQALVADPVIKAVGFTGSRSGGTALMATAAARPEPIPVYAEMSSINPVLFFDGALSRDPEAHATAYLGSVTGSSGQLCTAPGLVFVPVGAAGDAFVEAIGSQVPASPGQTMLTEGIYKSWQQGVDTLGEQGGVQLVGRGRDGEGENAPAPTIYSAGVEQLLANPVLQEEIFGAASLVIRYSDPADLATALAKLEGQLTATLQLEQSDYAAAAQVLPVLEQKVGRILVNGWPTGVEVGHAMVHGGPFPATSAPHTTSVGTLAIERFLRPVAYQNFPEDLLPAPIRQENPWNLNRRVDGVISIAGE
ncbi:aldehyde dehydrogenase (NADP(+)) [Glutamicibacter sp. MNS18]|uniref:aldehyde dehydrogenase (NADP(+)) n=1 Tax=Glutamicibacter sp. MNS18 TaxID=2989817 RepID=UPI002236A30E|nr:aldehyde dehydrogenase (NADP(+)) [Glutamicibacter sp. MNS18]MCW4465660.1 aldehyde dehydrogenase (NADP(+)) [Glutamicibacter sp. MNS18]